MDPPPPNVTAVNLRSMKGLPNTRNTKGFNPLYVMSPTSIVGHLCRGMERVEGDREGGPINKVQ